MRVWAAALGASPLLQRDLLFGELVSAPGLLPRTELVLDFLRQTAGLAVASLFV
jgi:hypothetical protein